MPQFILDTSGAVTMEAPDGNDRAVSFERLDAFTQGYIEALFFTDGDDLCRDWTPPEDGSEMDASLGFADLAPEALASIIADCAAFQAGDAFRAAWDACGKEAGDRWGEIENISSDGGRDFWYTRNGHGRGFWDGDWPEPYASELDEAAKAFGEVSPYLGEDGKVYLS